MPPRPQRGGTISLEESTLTGSDTATVDHNSHQAARSIGTLSTPAPRSNEAKNHHGRYESKNMKYAIGRTSLSQG